MVENAATYNGGWIQVHRKITEWEFYHSERFNKTHAWLDLLLLAAWKPRTIFREGCGSSLAAWRPGMESERAL